MDLREEIRSKFAACPPDDGVPISGLAPGYEAWVVKRDTEYGVAVRVSDEINISERFSSVRIWTSAFRDKNNEIYHLLLLTCHDDQLRLEFSTICAQFVDPGADGSERKKLISDPLDWWRRWRDLLGNSVREKSPHAVLGELLTTSKLLELGEKPEWIGGAGGVNDIVCGSAEYEVKSTTMRYDTVATISGQFQLKHKETDTLYLVYCRFEESSAGISIDDMFKRLECLGYNAGTLEKTLLKLGYEPGSYARRRKYRLLEMRRYIVDDHFPRITPSSFKDGKMHPAIIHLSYKINLAGLDYEDWMKE